MCSSASRCWSAPRVYSSGCFSVVQPYIAIKAWADAPLLAAMVAPALRSPCAEQCGSPALTHWRLNQWPKDPADEYGSPKCIVKLGCWGPVVQCNVGKRGWMDGIGGCANVGGICIGCTMPGFPDKFMPFMDEPPGAKLSTTAVTMYGRTIRALRKFTQASQNKEPEWRKPAAKTPTRDEPPTT